ncbi:putative class II aldolase/adducin, n-terminal protein [Ralstonia insidiosa]|uniref:Class II aldolase/adducin, n-terminal protein n=2 Tax=Ralstonia TaxID=48736 RepID=A0AAC9FQR2_9RALS|nr:putative class II aldolase/adducin, n-terminal protein [Ralstonia insidiosa]
MHEQYRREHPKHPALVALERWEQPASEFRLSEQLSAARGTLALLEVVQPA